MNYKLLANLQYQVHSRCKESGILTLNVNLESLKKFNEELIVQEHEADETHIKVEISMLTYAREEFSIVANGGEIKRFSREADAHDFMEAKIEALPLLKDFLELEILEVEDFRVPPSHEIRRQLLSKLVVNNDDYNDDDRGNSSDHYDGYVGENCHSDGTPIFT